jgi:protocatechuate 3,4-dioxygenase beta subunit
MLDRNGKKDHRALFEALEPRNLFASTISGTVFNEPDADGLREAGESGLANQRVYVDSNGDGKWQKKTEASLLTDANGAYRFTTEAAGVYRVRLVTPKGYRQSAPGKLYYDVTANGSDIHVANDFGLTRSAVIRGTVFDDANGDGTKQNSEPGLSGVRVYIDKNNNGQFDSESEKSRITNAQGEWRFAGLSAGKYRIRIELPGSMQVTTPSRGFLIVELSRAQSLSNRVIGLT